MDQAKAERTETSTISGLVKIKLKEIQSFKSSVQFLKNETDREYFHRGSTNETRDHTKTRQNSGSSTVSRKKMGILRPCTLRRQYDHIATKIAGIQRDPAKGKSQKLVENGFIE